MDEPVRRAQKIMGRMVVIPENFGEMLQEAITLTPGERYVLERAYGPKGGLKYSDAIIAQLSRTEALSKFPAVASPLSRHQVRSRRINGLKKLGILRNVQT